VRPRRLYFRRRPVPLGKIVPAREVCLELPDHSVVYQSAIEFFGLRGFSRDPFPQAARLVEQFAAQNRSLFSRLDVKVGQHFDGKDLFVRLESGSAVGAVPLFSPTSARPDYGLVIQPRFPWAGIGPMLAQMGWRIVPTPLKLPLMRRSERRVPPWVLSFMILARIKALLDLLSRRFETVNEFRNAPHGQVHWPLYATRQIPRANFLSIPCTFPDLRDDRFIRGAIRYALERQLQSLQTQIEHGAFIHRLIEFCQQMLQRVQMVPMYIPSATVLASWLQRPLKGQFFAEGLQAIEWTIEDRGLAGLSDLEGIPWTLSMEEFFEAWAETILHKVARYTGGQLKVGRKRETTQPISWNPPYSGSQKSLMPDLWLEWNSTTLIVDAKYKRHWEELHEHSWSELEDQLREQHRNDLFQILAYANLARTQQVITCLSYPCSFDNWKYLKEKGKLVYKAEIAVGSRVLYLWLTAFPMASGIEEIAEPITAELKKVV
jgi:hypothetical protein